MRVLSTIEPMMGSLRASKIRQPSMSHATAMEPLIVPIITPSAPKRRASVRKIVRYEPMIVQMKFWPKPATL